MPGGELSEEVLARLERELNVINTLGFPNYFLIVWDFVRFAVEQNIPATARGSGVGSLVAFALELSHVCPLKYDLLFERFLDISRREAPDIDIDFCKDRRGEVIDYVKQKYGSENVAQIGTFGTLAARAAIRDVGRAMGLPIPRVDSVVAMVPEQLGIELSEALEKSEDLKKAYESDGEVRELLDLAMKIEGLAAIDEQQGLELRLLLGRRQLAPVVHDPGQRGVAMHDLERIVALFPAKARAQAGVSIDRGLPRRAQALAVAGAGQTQHDLRHVMAGAGREQRMKQQTLLHRRQGIHVLDREARGGRGFDVHRRRNRSSSSPGANSICGKSAAT